MGKFYATPACVSDALGNNVDFDTEYMYTPEGNKLPISYFKYDREQGWIAVTKIKNGACKTCKYKRSNCEYKDKLCFGYDIEQEYIVSSLYMQHPTVRNLVRLDKDMNKLLHRIHEYEYDTSYALFMYVYEDLDKKDPRIKALTATRLIEIIVNDILDKLHKLNEAEEN